MEIVTEKVGKRESIDKEDNWKRNNEETVTRGKGERNIRCRCLNTGPYRLAVTGNNRRAINPLTMGKFQKINDVPCFF
jgi:hypothetical protein